MSKSIAITDIAIDDVIALNIYGNSALPNMRNCVVNSWKSGKALNVPETAAVNHANILPAIPDSVIKANISDYRSYQYIDVTDANGVRYEIGISWIVPDSVTRIDRSVCLITIGDFDTTRLTELTDLLKSYDFNNVTITLGT